MENFLVDIGACTGQFTDSWLRLNPEGFVLCVEPHPDNYASLVKKYEGNANVKVAQAAVTPDDSASSVKFYFGTTEQNGSLCTDNEAQRVIQVGIDQGAWPEMHFEDVDAISINKILSDIKSEDTYVTLKIDVEGLEFRILNAIEDENFPDILYLEDSCAKTRNKNEWAARIKYFQKVKQTGIENINIEKRPLIHEEYILNYANISEYERYRHFENIDPLRYPLLKSAQELAKICIENATKQNEGIVIDRVEFPFYMTNCHAAIVITDKGESGEVYNEDPLFYAEWVDWVYGAVTNIIVKSDMSISVKLDELVTIDETQGEDT